MAGKLRRAPTRIVTGAFILNSGLQKLNGDDETAKGVHGMASGAYPAIGSVPPKTFLRTLGAGETALGAALLLPIVPARVAGAGLLGFSGALLGMWWRTPGMHDGLRPTQQGTAIAKDSWMLGIGAGLLLDDIVSRPSESHAVRRAERRAGRQATRRARKAEAKLRAEELKHELKAASAERRKQLKSEARKRAKALQAEAKAQAKSQAKSARAAALSGAESARKAALDTAGSARKSVRKAADHYVYSARDSAADAGKSVRKTAEQYGESARKSVQQAGGTARDAATQAGKSVRSTAESLADKVGA
jgi:uncharacterized membrane protein YphA (DoxX/SURF4 family)